MQLNERADASARVHADAARAVVEYDDSLMASATHSAIEQAAPLFAEPVVAKVASQEERCPGRGVALSALSMTPAATQKMRVKSGAPASADRATQNPTASPENASVKAHREPRPAAKPAEATSAPHAMTSSAGPPCADERSAVSAGPPTTSRELSTGAKAAGAIRGASGPASASISGSRDNGYFVPRSQARFKVVGTLPNSTPERT